MTEGFPKDVLWKYCKLTVENKDKPSYFEFELKLDGKYYSYGFEVILSKQLIISEWLYEICPSGQDKEIFSRDILGGKYSVAKYFSSKQLLAKLNVYADDIKADGSVLLLKLLNQNKNTLYTEYEESKVFRTVFKWFQTQLDINFPDRPISDYSYFVSDQDIKTICSTLEAFGTGITKYSIVETSPEKMSKEIPPELIDDILSKLNEQKLTEKDENDRPTIILRGDKSFFIFESDSENNITCKTIHFNHGNDNVFFELSEESDGTTRLLDLLTVLFETVEFLFSAQFFLSRERDSMRISKTFGERKHVLVSDNPKKKYFFAYEGSETERLYFDGIRTIKEKLGIDALLEIVPILRSCNEEGWSHPIRVLSCLMEFLQQMQTGEYKISTAVKNEKLFAESVPDLKHKIGSNIGLLITELM